MQAVCSSCGAKNRIPPRHLADTGKCGRCKAALPPRATPIELPDVASFDALVAEAKVPVLVDFWAPWWGPCRTRGPHVADLAVRHAGKLIVVKLNTQDHRGFPGELGIQSIPTLCVFKSGELVNRQIGAVFGRELDRVVEPYL